MENASKALLIAGGILIAIIITSVFVYMYNQLSDLPKTQEQIKEAEELTQFNKKYEAYARDISGTDLISVINMANDNNTRYKDEDYMQIKISFTLTNSIDSVIRTYKLENNQWKILGTEYKQENESMEEDKSYTNVGVNETKIPEEIKNYFSLSRGETKSELLFSIDKTNNQWKEELSNDDKVIAYKNKTYYSKTNVVAELKRRKFKCTSVTYSETTGRVESITYQEK